MSAVVESSGAAPSAPVGAGERMTVLDAIRGVAVLGILLINVDALSGYAFTPASSRTLLVSPAADAVTWFLLAVFVEGKFYSLFSFALPIPKIPNLHSQLEVGRWKCLGIWSLELGI